MGKAPKFISVEGSEELCSYGCGNVAKYLLKFKKGDSYCCEQSHTKCSLIKENRSNSISGEKNPMFHNTHSEKTKKILSEKNKDKKWKETFKPVELVNSTLICYYGCKNIANYKFNNGRACCSYFSSQCPSIRELNRLKKIPIKTEKYTHSCETINLLRKINLKQTWSRLTYENIIKKFPYILEFEEIRKYDDLKIEVRCRKCRKWFIPTKIQLDERLRTIKLFIKRKIFNKYGAGFYCSNDCKQKSEYYKSRKHLIKEKVGLEEYRRKVSRFTYRNIKNYYDKIDNNQSKNNENFISIDHKYSVSKGYKNDIPPEIIGHYKNLKYIPLDENRRKNNKCSITLEELLYEIEQVEFEDKQMMELISYIKYWIL